MPKFYPDYLQLLLNRVFLSLEWCLNSPPKPHAFASLPIKSVLDIPASLIDWQAALGVLNPGKIVTCITNLVHAVVFGGQEYGEVNVAMLLQILTDGSFRLLGIGFGVTDVWLKDIIAFLYNSLIPQMVTPYNETLLRGLLEHGSTILWSRVNGVADYHMLVPMLNSIPAGVADPLHTMLQNAGNIRYDL